jgi:hypothetical protein
MTIINTISLIVTLLPPIHLILCLTHTFTPHPLSQVNMSGQSIADALYGLSGEPLTLYYTQNDHSPTNRH